MFQVSCRGRKSGQSHGVSCSVTNYYRAICKDSHCGYCPRTTSKKHPAVGKSCRSRTTTRYEHRNIEVEIISVSREAITGSESVRNVPSRIGDSPGECRCCNELMSTVKHCENKAVRRDPKKSRSCNGGRVCGRTRCVTEKRVSGDLSKVREGQVAPPKAESERGNWLVQEVPAYSARSPPESVKRSAEVRAGIVRVPTEGSKISPSLSMVVVAVA